MGLTFSVLICNKNQKSLEGIAWQWVCKLMHSTSLKFLVEVVWCPKKFSSDKIIKIDFPSEEPYQIQWVSIVNQKMLKYQCENSILKYTDTNGSSFEDH